MASEDFATIASSDFSDLVRPVPDFPKPGILFRDIMPIFANPAAFAALCDSLAERIRATKCSVDAIAGLEARGFLLGPPVALRLNVPFIPVRKAGKLPGKVLTETYSLEYGTDSVQIQADAVQPQWSVVVLDDLLATGGTASAACRLLSAAGATVPLAIFVIELSSLNGSSKLKELKVPMEALLQYD